MNLTTLAVAMRAANVADVYMTKYQSEAQEKLGPIMQPFISGTRRIEEEEMKQTRFQNGEPRDATEHPARGAALVEMARRRIRRFVFSANRTMDYLSLGMRSRQACYKAARAHGPDQLRISSNARFVARLLPRLHDARARTRRKTVWPHTLYKQDHI